MVRPCSVDLRERVVGAVESGESCRRVLARFSVSVASVVRWSHRFRTTGSVAAKPMGSRLPRLLLGERAWILARLDAKPDITLRALVAELHARGVRASYGSVWRLLNDEGLSFKKKRVRQRAGAAGRGAPTGTVEAASGEA